MKARRLRNSTRYQGSLWYGLFLYPNLVNCSNCLNDQVSQQLLELKCMVRYTHIHHNLVNGKGYSLDHQRVNLRPFMVKFREAETLRSYFAQVGWSPIEQTFIPAMILLVT